MQPPWNIRMHISSSKMDAQTKFLYVQADAPRGGQPARLLLLAERLPCTGKAEAGGLNTPQGVGSHAATSARLGDSARTDADVAVAPAVRGPHVHVGRVRVGQLHQMDLNQVPETLRPQRLTMVFLIRCYTCNE